MVGDGASSEGSLRTAQLWLRWLLVTAAGFGILYVFFTSKPLGCVVPKIDPSRPIIISTDLQTAVRQGEVASTAADAVAKRAISEAQLADDAERSAIKASEIARSGKDISRYRVTKNDKWEYAGANEEGFAVWSISDSSVYRGHFDAGSEATGLGVENWNDKSTYRGDFAKHYMNGIGVLASGNGGKYQGEFQKGKYSGFGVYFGSSNDPYRFSGQFVEDRIAGYGTMMLASGTIIRGHWSGTEHGIAADGYAVVFDSHGKMIEGGYYRQCEMAAF